MKAYKLVRKLKDGNLAPLFINKTFRFLDDFWHKAGSHPTRGYAYRPGWHCCLKPEAPHLSEEGRVWVECEVDGYEILERPASQGGTWLLAKYIKIIRELP